MAAMPDSPILPPYVLDVAQAVAGYFARGRPCEIAYTPGNSTLYELIFTPVESLACAAERMEMQRNGRSIKQDRPELNHEDESMLILSWLGHGAWPVDLRAVWHDSYIAEKYADCSFGDATAIRQLLLAVAEAAGFRSLAVVR